MLKRHRTCYAGLPRKLYREITRDTYHSALSLAAGRREHVLEILLLKALPYQDQGNLTPALSALAAALELTRPEEYTRTFIDEGPAMAALLRKIRTAQSQEMDYVDGADVLPSGDGLSPEPALMKESNLALFLPNTYTRERTRLLGK